MFCNDMGFCPIKQTHLAIRSGNDGVCLLVGQHQAGFIKIVPESAFLSTYHRRQHLPLQHRNLHR